MANPIPNVPLRTPMFDGDMKALGNLSRLWAQFFSDGQGWISQGTHAERLNANPGGIPDGAFFIEKDRGAIYQSRFVGTAQAWVLVAGFMTGVLGMRPNGLGPNDAGLFYSATDALDYRWNGTAWATLDTVRGGAALVNVGAIPKVTAAGTLGESVLKDDGTNVSLKRAIAGAVQPTFLLDDTVLLSKIRLTRYNGVVARLDLSQNLSYDGTDYSLDDITKNGTLLTFTGTDFRFWTCAAGANPATARLIEIAHLTSGGKLRVGDGTAPGSTVESSADVNATTVYRVGGVQVVQARGAALTAATAAVTGTAVNPYDNTTRDIINNLVTLTTNLRTRVNELEARLSSAAGHGLIT